MFNINLLELRFVFPKFYIIWAELTNGTDSYIGVRKNDHA